MPFHSHPPSPSKGKISKGRQGGLDESSEISTGMLHAAQLLGSIAIPNTTNPLLKAEAKPVASHYMSTEVPRRKPVQSSAPGYQAQPHLQPHPNSYHPIQHSQLPYPETPDSPIGGAKLPVLISHPRTLPSHIERPLPREDKLTRLPEELHLPTPPSVMSDVHQYQRSNSYMSNDPLSIQTQQATPQHSENSTLPGSLQPGQFGRPGPPSSVNTAPGSIPTLPQISTQLQESTTPARTVLQNHSHSYSRSSPAGLDQPKYKPFSATPTTSQFSSPNPSFIPHTPQASSYSPLGLEDIRSRDPSGFGDGPASPSVYPFNGELQYPTKNNYVAPWPIYALDWCKWPLRSHGSAAGKIAVGSYLEDDHNYVSKELGEATSMADVFEIQILDAHKMKQDPDDPQGELGLEFVKTAEATHAYPVTRVLWEPQSSGKQAIDLLATSGDHLRLWSLPADSSQYQSNSIHRRHEQPLQKLSPLALLSNSKSPEHTAPITSLDWNTVSPSLIITSSIDTTCTIWDIPTLTAKTQLIAHDKEVFDVRFCAQSVDVFVSCGADGSVRMFDLRSLEHSTIIYEPSDKTEKGTSTNPHFTSTDLHVTTILISNPSVYRSLLPWQPLPLHQHRRLPPTTILFLIPQLPPSPSPHRRLPPRRSPSRHLLPGLLYHPRFGCPPAGPGPARTQGPRRPHQLHRVESESPRAARERGRRFPGVSVGSYGPCVRAGAGGRSILVGIVGSSSGGGGGRDGNGNGDRWNDG